MATKAWNQMSTDEKLEMLHGDIDLILSEIERFKHNELRLAGEIDNLKRGIKGVVDRVFAIEEGSKKKKG